MNRVHNCPGMSNNEKEELKFTAEKVKLKSLNPDGCVRKRMGS